MSKRVKLTICVAVWAFSLAAVPVLADEDAARLFTLKILPLLKDKCAGCHGGDAEDIKGEFSVLTREALLRGGESEDAAVVPGKPDQGTLIDAISWTGLEMPPKENDRLSGEQIKLFQRWIESGAPWPDEKTQQLHRDEENRRMVTAEGTIIPTSGGTSDEWTYRRYQPDDLWAFSPVRSTRQLLPEGIAAQRAIDYFIDDQIKAAGLTVATRGEPRHLIRRATFDLIGLPATPAEVAAFEAAHERDPELAWSALIDRLLESPRYGEHWARHWLDVARYADTGGMSNDYERSNMWRYRDYVIRSFNQDQPYNQFIVEQLAGDEMADAAVRNRNGGDEQAVKQAQLDGDYRPEEAEWLVASGFLRLGAWDNAMVETAEARQIYLDDLVNNVGQTFLSTAMRCCKCHDHKFDPLPTRDYYRMYAAFATTQMAERPVPFLPTESRERFEAGKSHVQRMLDFAVAEKNKLIDKREAAARAWFNEHGLPYKNENQRKELADEEKPPRHVGLDHVEQGQLKVREQDEWIWERSLERYQPMAQSVYNSAATDLAWNGARKLRISTKNNKQSNSTLVSYILQGGALTAQGDVVQPGVLSAAALPVGSVPDDPYLVTDAVDGRRLELAGWIADPRNPLTARSIVNRIWQYHFGVGIAGNPNNFGAKGAKPTHPQLLDYLAADFVEQGWTIKRMHRAIMMSEAYRRSSVPADEKQLSQIDPNNELLSFFPRRRLTAEEIRDGILAITGELQEANGGLPVMPEINMEVALQPRMIQFSLAPAYQPSPTPAERNRRSIYAYTVRGQADPFMELFNQPNPNESCELRESAAVTPQVFALLNSDLITARSIAMAVRLQRERDLLSDQLAWAFRLVFGRTPAASEQAQLAEYYQDMCSYHESMPVEAASYPTSITRSLVEEFSGDVFEYAEILPVFENYTPDQNAADVSPATRALADVCLLLMNSNEFLYVE